MISRHQPGGARRYPVLMAALAVLAVSLACSFAMPLSVFQTSGQATLESPLGLIAYQGNDGNIYTTDRNGKQITAITQDAAPNAPAGQPGRVYEYLTWAPDGQHLAFVRVSANQTGQDVSLLSALSNEVTRPPARGASTWWPRRAAKARWSAADSRIIGIGPRMRAV